MPTAAPAVAVLDDEPEMRKALRRLLTARGFRVEEYDCGESLLAGLAVHSLDYLLLDLHMPQMSGLSVLEALRARQSQVPVIVITAHDEPGMAERTLALGAFAYLRKPVDRDTLLAVLAAARPDPQDHSPS